MRATYDDDVDRYSPTVRRRRLGLAMRRYREALDLTTEQAGQLLGLSESQVTKMEKADRTLTKPVLLLMFDRYNVPVADRAELLDMHSQSRERGWWQPLGIQPGTFVDFEAEAATIRSFDTHLVPGLLQTERYAEALMGIRDASPREQTRWREVRRRRAELLTEPDGPKVWLILHEAAVTIPVGSRAAMVEQIRHVADMAEKTPGLEVQIVPFETGEYASMESSFAILSFEDLPTLGYIENVTSGVWIEKQSQLDVLDHTFGKLISQAMQTRDTIKWLRMHADGMEQNDHG